MVQIISNEQLSKFQKDGYVKISSFYNQSEIEKIITWTDEVQNFKETPGKWQMYFETSQDNQKNRILC